MRRLVQLTGMMSIILTVFAACENNGDDGELVKGGSLTVQNQVISQNMIEVESATIKSGSGWLVVHKDDNGSPMVPDIITEPVHIDQGTTDSVLLEISSDVSISDGENVWVMLHEDTGEENEYEFSGSDDLDPPVQDDGLPVTTQITIESPRIAASDQSVSDHMALIDQVDAGIDGWVVVHKDNGSGAPGPVVGYTGVAAGSTEDVQVSLTDTVNYEADLKLFPMLHVDKGTKGEYEFPGEDIPEVFGNSSPNIVLTSFMVDSSATTQQDTVTIEMADITFSPKEKTISAGTTVKWVNKDSFVHDVVSDDGLFDSGDIEENGTFTYTFNNVGTFDYNCTYHTGMDGTINVE